MSTKNEDPKVTWTGRMGDTSQRLLNLSDGLKHLSSAFYTTGNETVANKLDWMSEEAYTLSKTVSDLCGEEVHRDMMEAAQRTAAIFESVLAGAELANRQNEETQS